MPTSQSQRHIRWIHAIARARTLEDLATQVARAIRDLAHGQGAAFVLRDQSECVYLEVDAIGPLWKGERFPLSACVCGWSMLNRQPAIVKDVLNDERTPSRYYRGRFVKSLLVVPVRGDDPLGALVVYWDHAHTANTDQIASAQTIADAAAVGVENIRLLLSIEQSRADAERRASENAALTERLTHSLAEEARSRELLRQGEERFRNMADNVPAILWATDAEGMPYYFNRRWSEFTGLAPETGLGEGWRQTIHPDDLDPLWDSFGAARARRIEWKYEFRQRNAAGEFRWMLAAGTPWHGWDGSLLGYVGSVVDITERRAMEDALRSSEERMRFMMMELDHRVKNTLASVLSVCDQTFQNAPDLATFRHSFHGRLQAMARTHEALAMSKWAGVRVRQMVHLTVGLVAPGRGDGLATPRLNAQGPDTLLPASAAMPLAATLHELATNSLKHGAWARADGGGVVDLRWDVQQNENGSELRMAWHERGGRPVTPPGNEGFGVSMIRGMIGYELRGRVDLRFPPTGVECDLVVPLQATKHEFGLDPARSSRAADTLRST